MIHYHGTPMTPKEMLYRMAGKHLCVSFANAYQAKTCMEIGQSVMWDNGAFTTYTQGKNLDRTKLYSWLEDKIGHPHWAVIPDVIGGDEEHQRSLLSEWPFGPEFGAPVWHMDMPFDYLMYLTDHYKKICFGSSGQYWNVGSDAWCGRADAAFNMLAQKHSRMPWIHMLRGLSLAGERWPFASADSVNVARNYKDYDRCPELMARKIDSVQTPFLWEKKPIQQCMFGGKK